MSLLAAAAIAGGLSLVGSYLNSKTQQSISDKNVAAQQDTNALNEQLTRESWARDDNAVQRRVADLTAAGLSPTLAAGSAAGNSSPIEMKSPEYTHSGNAPLQAIGPAIEMAGQVVGIEQMLGQVQKQKAEIEKIKAETITKVAESVNADNYYQLRNKSVIGDVGMKQEQRKLAFNKNILLEKSMNPLLEKYALQNQLNRLEFQFMNDQYQIFKNTGFDVRQNYNGVGGILKALSPSFSDYFDKRSK